MKFFDVNGYKFADAEGEDSYSILLTIYSVQEIPAIRKATVHHSIAGEFTIRQGRWKLLLSASSGGSFPKPSDKKALQNLLTMQLYNMHSDPKEI